MGSQDQIKKITPPRAQNQYALGGAIDLDKNDGEMHMDQQISNQMKMNQVNRLAGHSLNIVDQGLSKIGHVQFTPDSNKNVSLFNRPDSTTARLALRGTQHQQPKRAAAAGGDGGESGGDDSGFDSNPEPIDLRMPRRIPRVGAGGGNGGGQPRQSCVERLGDFATTQTTRLEILTMAIELQRAKVLRLEFDPQRDIDLGESDTEGVKTKDAVIEELLTALNYTVGCAFDHTCSICLLPGHEPRHCWMNA